MRFWKQKARELKIQTYALYLAYHDPRVPWVAKGLIVIIVAYAFSPIDLIPDFIPVLGYLDDFVILPLGVLLAIRMVPAQVMEECRAKAQELIREEKPQFKFMGVIIIGIWTFMIVLTGWLLIRAIK